MSQPTTQADKQEFGFLRSLFFPIYTFELKKFLPMAFMMLFILFNYTVLRNIKDSLVINAKGSDAEIISFLKLWGTTPSAVLFMLYYSKLTNLFNKKKVFTLCIVPFLVFFGAFAFVIYPNVDILHPSAETISSLQESYPRLKWFIAMGGNWSYTLFYILAELWGSVMLSLLFWQFANDIVKKEEAKRFYPLFGFVGNFGLVLSGNAVKYFTSAAATQTTFSDPWQFTLVYLMSAILVSGVIILALYGTTNKIVAQEEAKAPAPKKKKPKLSLGESFRYLISSPHLLFIALLVFSYGVTMNFMDVFWKGQVKILTAGDPNAYAAYMGKFAESTGLIALPLMLMGGQILRRFSWLTAASIVPTIMLITGGIFLSLIIWGTMTDPAATVLTFGGFDYSIVMLAVTIGLWQNSAVKASKYSLFDSTKEMAYIPLDEELKTKGKAAVDVVGGRSGKSGGALTFVVLQTLMPGMALTHLAPYIAGVFFVVMGLWFVAAFMLNRYLFKKEGVTEGAVPAAA